MWCVIPAAGQGTRMAPAGTGRPKPLLEIEHGQTLIGRILDDVSRQASDICIVRNPDDETLSRSLGTVQAGVSLTYVVQPEPRGVGDAVCRARAVVDGPFAVVMGDAFYEDPLAPYLARWEESDVPGAVLVEEIGEPPAAPMGYLRARDGTVAEIRKTEWSPQWTHRVSGAVMLPPEAFRACDQLAPADTGEVELESIVSWLLSQGTRFRILPYAGRRLNINTPDDLEEVRSRRTNQDTGR